MKKVFITLFTAVSILLSCLVPVYAEEPRVVDNADLLSRQELSALEEELTGLREEYGIDAVIVTADTLSGETPQDYADDYYDYNGYGQDGILLLISIEDSDWYISTAGVCITAFTDAGIAYIGKQITPYLSDGDFAEAFHTFAVLCDDFMTQAQTGDPYDSHNLPKDPFNALISLVVALVIGLIAALVVTGIMKGKLKTVRMQAKADDYVKAGSMKLTRSRDLFLYTHLDRREKPKSGSGSSTHVSSSGTTHGGGGGKF